MFYITYELLKINTRLTRNSSICKKTKLPADFVYSVFVKPWNMRIHIAARIVLYHLKNHYHLSFNHILPFQSSTRCWFIFYFSIEMYITVCNNVISVYRECRASRKDLVQNSKWKKAQSWKIIKKLGQTTKNDKL